MQAQAGNAIRELRRRLNTSLFPAAGADGSTLGPIERVVVLLAVLALAIVLQLFRAGPSFALGTVWAEDGPIFLQRAISEGFTSTVFSPYAGYLVLMPRLIGEVGALVPLRDAAAALALVSASVVAISGLVVWYASAAHLPNPILRGTLVAATILAPVASLEAVTSGTYVAWYMLFATFWILLWRPSKTWVAGLAALFVLATALSTPGVWYFAPLAALRALAARDRRDVLIVGSFALGAAIQVPVVALGNETIVEPTWSNDIWVSYVQRVVDGAALGEHLGGEAWATWGWPFLILLLVCMSAGFAFGFMRATTPARWFAAIALPTSVLMFLGSAYQRAAGTALKWLPDAYSGFGGRYAIVPALLLVSVALVLVSQSKRPRSGPKALPWPSMAAACVVLVTIATSLDLSEGTARGTPSWGDALNDATLACEAKRLPEVKVATSPPGWTVIVPCDRLIDGHAPSAR
ncbi:MAG: hypothetical protein WD810_07930 [Solirubrobacterales bacterium]